MPPGPRMPATMQMLGLWYRREAFFQRCRARYGSPYTIRFRVPPVPFVVISDPDAIKEIFLAPPDAIYAGDGSAELEKYFGPTGLAYMEEEEHLERRKLLKQSTHGEAVKHMAASMADIVEREVASWPRDEVIELHPRLLRLALKVTRMVSFGPQQDERLDELLDVHTEMMRFSDSPVSFLVFHSLPASARRVLGAIRPLGVRRFYELRARADQLIEDVVEDRRRAGGDGYDMVSMLLSATHEDGSQLSWRELRDEIVTTFVAGSESTAGTLALGLDRLAREPAVRDRLVDEIEAGEDDAYLTATVQEILRLKPIVSVIPRLVMKPIEIGGWRYEPGVRLLVWPQLVHSDPSIYPEPYAFRPERFLENPPGTYTWVPFGGGRRRCLGNVIAQAEIKSVLREVVARYELRPELAQLDTSRGRAVVVAPRRGFRVTLSDRSRQPALAGLSSR